MFKPGNKKACFICCSFIDQYQGAAPHLKPRASLIVVGKAPYAEIGPAVADKDWDDIQVLSAGTSSFNEDLGVSWTAEQDAAKDRPYNYGRQWMWGTEGPGLSAFRLEDGKVYHT